MIIQEPIQAAIWHALNHYAFTDAIFLAERLYAEVKSDDALFLLATSYYRSGKPGKAYSLLQTRGCPTAQCRYLMAKCCMDMDKLSKAESWLMGGNLLRSKNSYEDLINEYGDAACFSLSLLGKIYSKTERVAKAAEQLKRSLKLNPFLWSSYEQLCNLGEKPDPAKVFQLSNLQTFSSCQSAYSSTCPAPTPTATQQLPPATDSTPVIEHVENQVPVQETPPFSDAVQTRLMPSVDSGLKQLGDQADLSMSDMPQVPMVPRCVGRPRPRAGRSLLGGPTALSPFTPSFGVLPLDTPSPAENLGTFITPSPTLIHVETHGGLGLGIPDPKAPTKKTMTRRGSKPPVFSQSGTNNTSVTSAQQSGLGYSAVTNVRRSSRLFSNANSVKENNKGNLLLNAAGKKNRTRGKSSITQPSFNELNELNKPEKPETVTTPQAQAVGLQKAAAEGLMLLLQKMGKAYSCLAQYNSKQAIEIFDELPAHHLNTGWVLSHLGRAHFELAEYNQACKYFTEVRRMEPYHLEGMEYYSTALWHLQKEVALSALAQELSDCDKESPEAWCAVGNCFSLQKEHDAAIKFFQRAVQVDASFAYAYTLLGHEYVLTEELDKAMSCFRNAIRIDPRHYNAWYGVGMIYYKQEKFSLAEVHFKKALSINPQSSVLMCHIGVVQHALQRSDQALATLNKAIATDPKNPLCKFHRASILFANDKHQDALKELEELKEIVPKESLVYFLIGKVHKKLGNTHLALMNFSWAMDLDPKGANNQIKEAIDKRYVNDDDEPSVGFDHDQAEGGEESLNLTDMSHESSIVDADEMHLHAMESDESL
ncbi:PREDICTED: cell division cycle protein 27 homolog [Priapulus caudatus]|uniref:Cell division cycle protein 27 homolog n=1 Tax=Priapulus caudatus TaxID=37621 RepID=A0ABM1ERW1_PRICU|nr:PREDICTED: cell division cycle protein 27 homolog [Priapulus caudatus]